MRKGELIKKAYQDMEIHRPFPWVGMPVYYKISKKWHFVTDKLGGQGIAMLGDDAYGIRLSSYRREKTNGFILPGEPNAPEMNKKFRAELVHAYLWGDSAKFIKGKWVTYNKNFSLAYHTFLMLPGLYTFDDCFPNNGKPKTIKPVESLKKLNTDGRLNCALCKGLLTQLAMGAINLNYCPVCEA